MVLGGRPFQTGHFVPDSRPWFYPLHWGGGARAAIQFVAIVDGRYDALAGAADTAVAGNGPDSAGDNEVHAINVPGGFV